MLRLILYRGLNVFKAALLSIFLTAVLVFALPSKVVAADSCQALFEEELSWTLTPLDLTSLSSKEVQLYQQLTSEPPAQLQKDIKLGSVNFKAHAEKHIWRPSEDKVLDYALEIDQFLKDQSPEIVYLNVKRRVFKFNPVTGQFLTISQTGYFISYFTMRGKTAEARMKRFLKRVSELSSSF